MTIRRKWPVILQERQAHKLMSIHIKERCERSAVNKVSRLSLGATEIISHGDGERQRKK